MPGRKNLECPSVTFLVPFLPERHPSSLKCPDKVKCRGSTSLNVELFHD